MSEDALLKHRDYTFILGRTATSVGAVLPSAEDPWAAALVALQMLAKRCEALDPDGVTVYVACQDEGECTFRRYDKLKSPELDQAIAENIPPKEIVLHTVLETALEDYFQRKSTGMSQPNGEIMMVILDGEPKDRMAIARVIRQATQKMDRDEELGISFLQIGEDAIATGFLTALDKNLQEDAGAKFDIVHTRHLNHIQPTSITEFLLSTLHD